MVLRAPFLAALRVPLFFAAFLAPPFFAAFLAVFFAPFLAVFFVPFRAAFFVPFLAVFFAPFLAAFLVLFLVVFLAVFFAAFLAVFVPFVAVFRAAVFVPAEPVPPDVFLAGMVAARAGADEPPDGAGSDAAGVAEGSAADGNGSIQPAPGHPLSMLCSSAI